IIRPIVGASREAPCERRLRRAVLALLVAACFAGPAYAQGDRLELGIAGQVVVDAWNPLRLVASDVPPGSVLTMTIDQGSLRSGPIPAVLTLPVSGGGGVSVVEERIFVPAFQSIAWSLASEARIIS